MIALFVCRDRGIVMGTRLKEEPTASAVCSNKYFWLSEGLCPLKYLNTLRIIL